MMTSFPDFSGVRVACRIWRTLVATALSLVLAASAWAVPVLDGNEDFKLLARLGFAEAVDGAHADGSSLNSYAWSMSWFKGKLYVGTGRFETDGSPSSLAAMTGQIWAYTPGGPDGATGTWARVYQSPSLIVAPREFGYRWMTTCNFGGVDYLFIATQSVLQGNILRTSDGVNFTALSRAGIPSGSVGFRTMVCFTEANGRRVLVTSPIGVGGDVSTYNVDATSNPIALVNNNPGGSGGWRDYSRLGMGEADNNSFFTMYTTGGVLYAGVSNVVSGGQLWKTTGCTNLKFPDCLPSWTKVIDRGAGRPLNSNGTARNWGFADMTMYQGHLYLAMSSPLRDFNVAVAELLRLRADGTFEIMIGEPRYNFGTNPNSPPTNPSFPSNLRCGLPLEDIDGVGGANDCPPTTRRGPGFGPVSSAAGGYPLGLQAYFWRLFNYAYHPQNAPFGDDRLYIGTMRVSPNPNNPFPGFAMLVSGDGMAWKSVTTNALGDPTQSGMRSLASTPHGLFIGGANYPLGFPNEIGGCSVWLGAPLPDPVPPVTTIGASPAEGSTVAAHVVGFTWTATDTPGAGSLPLTYASRLEPLEAGFTAFAAGTSRNFTNVPNGAYTFHVIAKDSVGNTEAAGGATNRRSFVISAPDLPPTVNVLTGPGPTEDTGNVAFNWLGSDDLTPPSGLTYDAWLSPLQSDPGTFGAATSAAYSGLADGSYTFHVIARDGAGQVSPEATLAFVVARPPGPPVAPSPATALVIAPRTVRVSWTDTPSETRFNVERCTVTKICTFAPVATNLPANATSRDDVIAGVASGSYRYRVQACHGAGCSLWAVTPDVFVP